MGCGFSKKKNYERELLKAKVKNDDLKILIQNMTTSKGKLYEELEFSRNAVKEIGKEKFEQFCEHEKEKKILKDKIDLLSCKVKMYKEQVEGVIEKHDVDYANSFLYLDK